MSCPHACPVVVAPLKVRDANGAPARVFASAAPKEDA